MASNPKLFLAAALVLVSAGTASAQQVRGAGDKDDQFVIAGCVMRSADIQTRGPQSMFVWSKGDFTELAFAAGGREATARIPTSWLGPSTRGKDIVADVTVRTVDVEKVTVMGPCTTR